MVFRQLCWQPPLLTAHSSISAQRKTTTNHWCKPTLKKSPQFMVLYSKLLGPSLPVKNMAAKPIFWTELSEANSSLRELPSEVITGGSLDPQKMPCRRISPEPILEDNDRLSYSQSCWKVNREGALWGQSQPREYEPGEMVSQSYIIVDFVILVLFINRSLNNESIAFCWFRVIFSWYPRDE